MEKLRNNRRLAVSKVVVLLFFMLGISACGTDLPEPTETFPTETVAATETTEPTVVAATEPEKIPFEDYEYLYGEGRNRKWEEDIVYLARTFLKKHPKISDTYYFEVRNYDDDAASFLIEDNQQYDESLRDLFDEEVESLIERLPELKDKEILFELQRIVALLDDAHSSVTLSFTEYFPVMVGKLEHEGELRYYTLRLPIEHESLIYSELVAINGVPLEEVVDKLRPYVSSESGYWEELEIIDNFWSSLFIQKDILQYVGIVSEGSDEADFEFRLEDGTTETIRLSAITRQQYDVSQMARVDFYAKRLYQFEHVDQNYWYKKIPEENLLYVRIYACYEVNGYAFRTFCRDVMNELNGAGKPMKVIFDYRGNTGGSYPMSGFEEFVDQFAGIQTQGCYILTDHAVASSSNGMVGKMAAFIPDAILVGTPTGQPANNWGNPSSYNTLNNKVHFRVSKEFWMFAESDEDDAIMPDITVYQTLEDYKQGIDTVLEYVRNAD